MNKFGYTVGNYVNINNVPKKIIGLTETHAIYYHDGCELRVPFEEIEPIRIDCDLLRKLGWIGDSSYLTIRIDDNSYFLSIYSPIIPVLENKYNIIVNQKILSIDKINKLFNF